MPLTRRRMDTDFESWAIMLDDIRVGTISQRAGIPLGEPPWRWICGFYPGCDPGQHIDGVADTFDQARAAFQKAWGRLLPTLPASAFDEYREWQVEQQIRDERIRNGWVPPEWDHRMTCPCGVSFDSWNPTEAQEHMAHIYAAQRNKP